MLLFLYSNNCSCCCSVVVVVLMVVDVIVFVVIVAVVVFVFDVDDAGPGATFNVYVVPVHDGSNEINLLHRHGYHARNAKECCRGQHGATVDENKRYWQSRAVASLAAHQQEAGRHWSTAG